MSSSSIHFELLDRIVDTEYGLTSYPRRSSLAGYQCQCGITAPLTIVPWNKVPFLWGYQILSMPPPFKNLPLAFPSFDYFRDCYTSKDVYNGTITAQPIAFKTLIPHPNHTEETLLDNCFDEDHTATLYTIHLPSQPPVFILYRYSALFEVKIL